jgi:hypothetical protein
MVANPPQLWTWLCTHWCPLPQPLSWVLWARHHPRAVERGRRGPRRPCGPAQNGGGGRG